MHFIGLNKYKKIILYAVPYILATKVKVICQKITNTIVYETKIEI
jgi:hypothetical protein